MKTQITPLKDGKRFLPVLLLAAFAVLAVPTHGEITIYNQNNPPDGEALPGGGWGTYRGFSVRFDDTALSTAYTPPDEVPTPATVYLTDLVLRHPGTQGAGSTAPGDWTNARLKVYTTQTPGTASYIGDSLNTNDMSQAGAERNVTFSFASLPINTGTTYYFYFANSEGNLPIGEITWTSGRLRVSNDPSHTYGSGNLINASWGNQDVAFDAVFAATFSSSPPSTDEIFWTADTDKVWDLDSTVNWRLSDNTPTVFLNGNFVTFDDSAASGEVQISGSPINPGSVEFANDTLAYEISGDGWGGPGTLEKTGAADVTLLINATYAGATQVDAGVLRVGDGGSQGTLGAGAVEIAPGATLEIARDGVYSFSNSLAGSGTLEISGPGTTVMAAGRSFDGATNVSGGVLRLAGGYDGDVTVGDGGAIATGTMISPGIAGVSTLALAEGSRSQFRVGISGPSDRLEVTETDGLVIQGTHSVDLIPTEEWLVGDMFDLFEYWGQPVGDLADLQIGRAPHGTYTIEDDMFGFIYVRIDALDTLVWSGSAGTTWDLDNTVNWTLLSDSSPAPYFEYDSVLFDDSAVDGTVELDATFLPREIHFNNDTQAFSFTGGSVDGSAAVVKEGAGPVVWASGNSTTGGTTVSQGTFTIGNGGPEGDIGFGPVVVEDGAVLGFNLDDSQLRDYSAQAKMRNVSGGGGIVVDGGFTLFNYTGGGLAFDSPGTWAGFFGDLMVKGESEFRTIRNGATAMGTGTIVLGDATTSGHLAQIEGNWTWTNAIDLVGPANEIRNRSGGAARLLKIQGAISGSGGLVFSDTAETMTNIQTGFILTGDNTLDGTVTIAAGTPVRVGGVPGNTDASQGGAGTGGSLGAATVINNGTLTFSRSDSHTVSSDISGDGVVFIGLSSGNTDQEMTYSGTATHTGGTTVRAGTLTIDATGSIGGPSVTVADGATLAVDGTSIADTATLNLGATALVDVSGTEVVEALFIDEVQVAAGTWGGTGSGATNIDDTRFTGTGMLSVTSGPAAGTPYDTWAAEFAWDDPADSAPEADPDGDGFSNYAEFLFGTSPLEPTGSLKSQATDVNGNLVLRWLERTDIAETYVFQQSATLESGSWTPAAASPADDPDQDGVPTDYVRRRVVIAPSESKLFFRVAVE